MIAFPEDIGHSNPSLPSPLPPPPQDTELLGDEIARLAAHLHAATYRLLVLIRTFDEQEGWGWGFRSCAQWLSWRTGIGPGPAREKVRVARALASLPRISAAMAQGEMSYSKVRALTRVASPENEAELLELARQGTATHVERLVRAWRRVDRIESAEKEAERHRSRFLRLYPGEDGMYVLRGRLDPEVGALLMKALDWAAEALYRGDAEVAQTEAGRDAETGRDSKSGADPESEGDAEAWEDAVPDATQDPDPSTTPDQRWADALGLIVEGAMASADAAGADATGPELATAAREPAVAETTEERWQGRTMKQEGPAMEWEGRAVEREGRAVEQPGQSHNKPSLPLGRADRFQVVVHVDAPVLEQRQGFDGRQGSDGGQAELADTGVGVPAGTFRRLACDANLVYMTHGPDGGVLDVGRKRRTVPPALRRALDYRDRCCRFPGCNSRLTDAHHITHWADGGETKLDNLVLLCRRHHRAVHEGGFRVEYGAGSGPGRGESAEGVEFYRPDNRVIPRVPEAPPVPAEPVREMERAHREQGVTPDAWTATPLWHGEPMDYSLAIDMLRPIGVQSRQEE